MPEPAGKPQNKKGPARFPKGRRAGPCHIGLPAPGKSSHSRPLPPGVLFVFLLLAFVSLPDDQPAVFGVHRQGAAGAAAAGQYFPRD